MKNLFPIPMMMEQTNLNIKEIQESILTLRRNKSPDKTNYTSFYDEDGLAGVKHKEDILNGITKFAKGYVDTCLDLDKTIASKIDTDCIQAWYNVYDEGIHHCWHDHGRSLLSGTLYIHTDSDSSSFLIRSPLYAIIKSWVGGEGFLNRWVQEEELRPVSGDIYIWPSWLEHSVPEQKPTSNPRISISFNIFVKR